MSIFLRPKKSPFWQFEFQIDGRIFSGSTKCTSKGEAAEYEKAEKQKARELIDNMRATRRRPMTVAVAFSRWWNEHGSSLKSTDEKFSLDWLEAQLGPGTLLHEVNDNKVSAAVAERLKCVVVCGRDDDGNQLYRPISPATVNKAVPTLLRRVMRRARDNWDVVILREPNWRKHMRPVTKRPVREITLREESRLDQVECVDYAALRRFAVMYGLRRREVLLTHAQIDFENGIFRTIGKGGKPRIFPITREALLILWPRRDHHETQVFTFVARRTRRCPHHGTLQEKGSRYPITYHGLGSRKQRDWATAGVDARIHDMRHTAGMRTLRTTRNLRTVQTLLGHAKITTTAEFYTDANLEDLRQALDETAGAYQPIDVEIEADAPKLLPKPAQEDT